MTVIQERVAVSAAQARRESRSHLVGLIESLRSEFAGEVPVGAVIAETVRARDLLLASGVRSGLIIAVEAMVRTRLGQRGGETDRS
jgi:hypothetical protein